MLVAEYAAGPAASALGGLSIVVGQQLTGWVAANARSVINSDARLDLGGDASPSARMVIAIPLVRDGSIVGVMSLYRAESFSADQSRMLEAIAPHLTTSLMAAIVV